MYDQAELERLFMAASRLEGRARRGFLKRAARENPELAEAVASRLERTQGRNGTLLREEDGTVDRAATERTLQRLERFGRFLEPRFVAPVLLIGVMGGGIWSWHAAVEGIDQLTEEFLEASLAETRTSLELYIGDRQRGIGLASTDPDLRGSVEELAALARPGGASHGALLSSPAQGRALDALDVFADEEDYLGFWIVDPSGIVLAGSRDDDVGAPLTAGGRGLLLPVLEGGQAILVKPGAIIDGSPSIDSGVVFSAPVRDENGQVVAALGVRLDSSGHFHRIFAEEGAWDTIVFDRNARLMSPTVWKAELERHELREDGEPGASTSVYLRDPGGDLTRGYEPEAPLAARPLTRMAASAITGETGIDLDGYRNMVGVEVVGAWAWVPEHGFGVAVEVSRRHLLGRIRPLLISFVGLTFGLLLLAFSAFGLSSALAGAMRRRRRYRLGQYTLLEKIGEGGMGVVYKARPSMLRRDTAVKILSETALDAESVARFEREVQLTSQLTHPNTVAIYDYGHDQSGTFYYAMEFLDGVTLATLLEEDGAQPPARVVHILLQVCGSLHEAHAAGLVHRDIKPANIMLCHSGGRDDVVKVLDFGLVKDVTAGEEALDSREVVRGTPLYIAPERIQDASSANPRTDIYSLGCVAFALLTGSELFEARTTQELLARVLQDPRPRASERVAEVPAELDDLVAACVARDPDARPESMEALARALESIASIPRWTQEDARSAWPVTRAPAATSAGS